MASQKLARGERLESELLNANEVPRIERDDGTALRFDRDFQHHIIVEIAQERAPEVKNLAVVRLRTHKVYARIDIRVRQA